MDSTDTRSHSDRLQVNSTLNHFWYQFRFAFNCGNGGGRIPSGCSSNDWLRHWLSGEYSQQVSRSVFRFHLARNFDWKVVTLNKLTMGINKWLNKVLAVEPYRWLMSPRWDKLRDNFVYFLCNSVPIELNWNVTQSIIKLANELVPVVSYRSSVMEVNRK